MTFSQPVPLVFCWKRVGLICLLFGLAATPGQADVFQNVPEATSEGFELVYTLPIQNLASYNLSGSVPYSVDNSSAITSPFDRIAYYLELDDGNGLQYVYVSMDSFTSDLSLIGLPADHTQVFFQQDIANMNVFSNSSGVTTGTALSSGNLEFWSTNYSANNFAGVAGASDTVFDFGDQAVGSGNYGSFQIHNHAAGETIIAYNQWGGHEPTLSGDLGIGNAPSGSPDWTFAFNADSYAVKNLQVLVRPTSLTLDSNLERAVVQRDQDNRGQIPLSGSVAASATRIEARAVPRTGFTGTPTSWRVVDESLDGGQFQGNLTLDGGWYDIEVRAVDGNGVLDTLSVERVGVGEVFLVAGQSNSANWGNEPGADDARNTATDDRVSARVFDADASFRLTTDRGWTHATDPMSIAQTGNGIDGGSPWPVLGDMLVNELDVPIGFMSLGIGGTAAVQWLPGDTTYAYYDNRFRRAINALSETGGFRAVLWHQGESDTDTWLSWYPNEPFSAPSTAVYQNQIETIIAQSRTDAGDSQLPWLVAVASYLSGNVDADITDAQTNIIEADAYVFLGANTDQLGSNWRYDNVHFNDEGLDEHAQLWFNQLVASFDFVAFQGDFDADDDVDSVDLGIWSSGYGMASGATRADGDADGDGDVDGLDFLAWQRNYGRSVTAPTTFESVPEPASALLAVIVVAGKSCQRWFRNLSVRYAGQSSK